MEYTQSPIPESVTRTWQLTSDDKYRVPNRVYDRLHRRDSRNPTMEVGARRKIPSRDPRDNVVSRTEEPDEGKVGKRYDACAIRDVTQDLAGPGGIAMSRSPPSVY